MANVARLLCLYILVLIFFSTHGSTIGWAYVGYVENYMDMKDYAWTEEIAKFKGVMVLIVISYLF